MKALCRDEPLATLVHISDLHFGDRFTTDESLFKKLLASLPYVQGRCPHSYQVARALAIRVNQILRDRKAKKIPTCVVFTGDLTSSGEEAEFVVGSTFLRSAHSTGAGQDVGLKLGGTRKKIKPSLRAGLFAIPGNHDIWMRRKPDALGAYRRHFPGVFPIVCEITTRSKSIFLYGLDSTQNTELRHRLARGRVSLDELDDLCTKLEAGRQKGATQIVCLHHPLSDPTDRSFDVTMQLEDRNAVAARLVESGATLVLAGHVHDWFILPCQSSVLPAHAVAGTAAQQFSERNFFLFDIYEKQIRLLVFEYDNAATRQFVPNVAKLHSFEVRNQGTEGLPKRSE